MCHRLVYVCLIIPCTAPSSKFSRANVTQALSCAVPERLEAHPNAQHPPLIDSDVLQSLNTSGALVTDADPVSRILHLAQRCSLRERSAVIISRKTVFNRPSQPVTELPEGKDCHSASQFSVLSFHISGSSFAILPKLPTDATATIDSILMPSQNNVRPASRCNQLRHHPSV